MESEQAEPVPVLGGLFSSASPVSLQQQSAGLGESRERSELVCDPFCSVLCPPGHQPVRGAAAARQPGPSRVQQRRDLPAGRSPVCCGLARGQAHL